MSRISDVGRSVRSTIYVFLYTCGKVVAIPFLVGGLLLIEAWKSVKLLNFASAFGLLIAALIYALIAIGIFGSAISWLFRWSK
jgi:hypothetical protein